jgi:CRISPR/Cas system-associated protein endoribonuclease Cas2
LAPTLSNFSLRWDVPLVICQIEVTEIRRGTRQITNKNPFSDVAINGVFRFPITKTKELMTYGAVYREALISESAMYQFLCYYRIIESIQARRKRLEREFAKQGKTYAIPVEVYPYTKLEVIRWLNDVFPVNPRIGMK